MRGPGIPTEELGTGRSLHPPPRKRRPTELVLTGATGFLGARVVSQLAERGKRVRALARLGSNTSSSSGSRVLWVTGDLLEPSSLAPLLEGARVLVHMAAKMQSSDEAAVRAVNTDGTRALLSAAGEAGVERIVFVSSVAAQRMGMGPYGESKREGEDLVRDSGLDWVILRPPLIYGPGSPMIERMSRMARLPMAAVPGGRALHYPVHVDDVASAVIQAALASDVTGRNYDLPGPEGVSLQQLVDRIRGIRGRPGRTLRLPRRLTLAGSRVLERLGSDALPREAVLGSYAGGALDGRPAAEALGFCPRGLNQGLSESI